MKIIEKDLTKLATIQTPAIAKYFTKIDSIEELQEVLQFIEDKDLNTIILGNGTNILFTQESYKNTMFIKLGKGFDFFNLSVNTVEIGGSYSFMRAGKKLTGLGYKDFVYMTLIPGSLGGGVRQNAGTTNEGEIKDNFLSATVYDLQEKRIKTLSKEKMEFSYRNSIIQKQANRYLVLSAEFYLGEKNDNLNSLVNFVKEKKNGKKEKEPSGYSFGSTFKSLLNDKAAWWYIDQIGFRGKSIGGAKFSEKHSNWIINFDSAKAEDIVALIAKAKIAVKEDFGVELQEEVEFIYEEKR